MFNDVGDFGFLSHIRQSYSKRLFIIMRTDFRSYRFCKLIRGARLNNSYP